MTARRSDVGRPKPRPRPVAPPFEVETYTAAWWTQDVDPDATVSEVVAAAIPDFVEYIKGEGASLMEEPVPSLDALTWDPPTLILQAEAVRIKSPPGRKAAKAATTAERTA